MVSDTLRALLTFANDHRPIYFDPGHDLRITQPDRETVPLLADTGYTLSTLVQGLTTGTVAPERVEFEDATAREYLHHLKETGFEDRLHHERLMNRERLVAFATAGYTTVDDLLGTADPIDIARDTGVDRSVVTDIVTNYIGGFSSAASLSDSGPLDGLEPKDSFDGWELAVASSNMIRWVSDGRFNLTISPAPNGGLAIECNIPQNRNAWYRKGHSIEAGVDESAPAAGVLKDAHSWLTTHQLHYTENLAQYPGIGPATRDFLALKYDITTVDGLEQFAETNPTVFNEIFGERGGELRAVLKEDQ